MPRPKRPFLRFHGAKSRLAPWIISNQPQGFVSYVEVFGGGAGVLRYMEPAATEVYNDIDSSLVSFFRVLRDPVSAERLQRQLELTPWSREEYKNCWAVSDDPVEDARRMVVRSFQSIGARQRLEGNGWRTRNGNGRICHGWQGYIASIPEFTQRLSNVIIEHLPWEEMFPLYDNCETLFFLDPPYLMSTRSTKWRRVYKNELTDEDHARLLTAARSLKGMVMVSGYKSDLYCDMLTDWPCVHVSARAQMNLPRTEYLWLNPRAAERRQDRLL